MVAGTEEGIVMVEAGAQQVTEETVVDAIEFGHECCKKIAAAISELVAKAGKPKREVHAAGLDQALLRPDRDQGRASELADALEHREVPQAGELRPRRRAEAQGRHGRLPEEQQRRSRASCFDALKERIFRDEMLNKRRRPDGRAFDQIRQITIEVGVLPRTHGSALFTRGETQALVTTTLGTTDDEQRLELSSRRVHQALHAALQLPARSAWARSASCAAPGRREIGHGALAERALSPMHPGREEFPYTMRVVCDILESNGSSFDGHRLRRHAGADGRRRAD